VVLSLRVRVNVRVKVGFCRYSHLRFIRISAIPQPAFYKVTTSLEFLES